MPPDFYVDVVVKVILRDRDSDAFRASLDSFEVVGNRIGACCRITRVVPGDEAEH